MSRSSGRGQTEPLAALVAVAAVCLGLSAYAGLVGDVLPSDDGPDATTALDTVADDLAPAGVALPARLDSVARPTHGLNVSLAVRGRSWTLGPTPPTDASHARRRLPVRTDPSQVRAGRLRVVVW